MLVFIPFIFLIDWEYLSCSYLHLLEVGVASVKPDEIFL